MVGREADYSGHGGNLLWTWEAVYSGQKAAYTFRNILSGSC